MSAATNYRVYTYACLAQNGGTRIFETFDQEPILSAQIKVSPNIGRARTKTKYWVSEKDTIGDYGQPTTGMFATSQRRWFYGDLDDKNHFLIFEFRENQEVLRIYYFEGFYPKNPKRFVIKFIKQ